MIGLLKFRHDWDALAIGGSFFHRRPHRIR
jgi:hypothetical protein